MSGPKRADVEAALRTAARAAQETASLVAATEASALAALASKLTQVVREAGDIEEGLQTARRELDAGAHEDDDTRAARRAVDDALRELRTARDSERAVRTAVAAAGAQEEEARRAFTNAQAELERAEQALRSAGQHYLSAQMEQAKTAKRLFDEAAALARRAATVRADARAAAGAATDAALRATAAAQRAGDAARAAARASAERARAAEEARRIVEQKRRDATGAFNRARIATDGLDDALVDKFLPGERDRLRTELAEVRQALEAAQFDEVIIAGQRVVAAVALVAANTEAARTRWAAARAGAQVAIDDLEALLGAVDTTLVEEWSGQPQAVAEARSARGRAERALEAEDFDAARSAATAARAALEQASSAAAEAKGQDLRRSEVGDAVMEVLEELGFDVSFDEGTLEAPMRISGQTQSAAGTGDFDVEIPLSGEIDFEVTASAGDTACVGAVEALQRELARRGIDWTVTDWGHAEGMTRTPTRRPQHGTESSTSSVRQATRRQAQGRA